MSEYEQKRWLLRCDEGDEWRLVVLEVDVRTESALGRIVSSWDIDAERRFPLDGRGGSGSESILLLRLAGGLVAAMRWYCCAREFMLMVLAACAAKTKVSSCSGRGFE